MSFVKAIYYVVEYTYMVIKLDMLEYGGAIYFVTEYI